MQQGIQYLGPLRRAQAGEVLYRTVHTMRKIDISEVNIVDICGV